MPYRIATADDAVLIAFLLRRTQQPWGDIFIREALASYDHVFVLETDAKGQDTGAFCHAYYTPTLLHGGPADGPTGLGVSDWSAAIFGVCYETMLEVERRWPKTKWETYRCLFGLDSQKQVFRGVMDSLASDCAFTTESGGNRWYENAWLTQRAAFERAIAALPSRRVSP